MADAVRETLELEGWEVDTCPNGATALKRIESDTHYDVLLLDYDLPRVNGIELVRRARETAHRKRTPIIMLSATDCEREAWRAGVQFGLVLEHLNLAEPRKEYVDHALVEFAAASYHFEKAGHERFHARVENNLGLLFSTVGKFAEAHEHVGRARRIFDRLKDSGSAAQVDDTRARVLLVEGRNEEAAEVARSAVRALERGGEQALLAEALTTHGAALARAGQHALARRTLKRAVTVAEQAGDLEGAGQATLTIIEELNEYLMIGELAATYQSAAGLLAGSQHTGVGKRLIACSVLVVKLVAAQREFADKVRLEEFKPPATWEGFSLRRAMYKYERFLVKQALEDAGGVLTRAAQLLGFKHHHSLGSLLNKRHSDLRPVPVVPRKRSVIGSERGAAEPQAQPVIILHAEDNRAVADAVRETLELEGWEVDIYPNGATALKRIESDTPYDVLLRPCLSVYGI